MVSSMVSPWTGSFSTWVSKTTWRESHWIIIVPGVPLAFELYACSIPASPRWSVPT